MDELAREREILNKNLLKAAAATTQQLDAVRLHEQNKKNLEQEVYNLYLQELKIIGFKMDMSADQTKVDSKFSPKI